MDASYYKVKSTLKIPSSETFHKYGYELSTDFSMAMNKLHHTYKNMVGRVIDRRELFLRLQMLKPDSEESHLKVWLPKFMLIPVPPPHSLLDDEDHVEQELDRLYNLT